MAARLINKSRVDYEPRSAHARAVNNQICFKVKNDHRSKFSNLSNWKEEA